MLSIEIITNGNHMAEGIQSIEEPPRTPLLNPEGHQH